jgi:hypothetical protein
MKPIAVRLIRLDLGKPVRVGDTTAAREHGAKDTNELVEMFLSVIEQEDTSKTKVVLHPLGAANASKI